MLTVIATLAVLAAGCNQAAPDGQVIAIVDGTEITLAELNEEARSRRIAIGTDRSAREALIQELVERKLLVQEAVNRNLDRSPQHLLAVRRLTEIALAQQLLATAAQSGEEISEPSLKGFIAANPEAFDQRALLSVDKISFAAISDAKLMLALRSASSVDEMERIAAKAGLDRTRSIETWDTATLPEHLKPLLPRLRAKRIFLVSTPKDMTGGQVIAVFPQPVPAEQRLAVAREWVERDKAAISLQQILRRTKPSARISYQPEFAPRSQAGR